MKNIFVIFIYASVLTSCGYVPIKNDILLSKNNISRPDDITSFKVLSWNIEKQSNPSWYNCFDCIHNGEAPNIILFQEAEFNDEIKKIIKNNSLNWGFSPNLYRASSNNYSGVLIASDMKPISMSSRVSSGREPFLPVPKPMLFSTYKLNSKELLVVNIHALNFTPVKFWNVGGEYDEQIMQIAEIVKHHDGPVVVGGDFNTWSSSRMDVLNKFLLNAGLTNINFGCDQGKIKTCHWTLKIIQWWCGSRPLDHIFYKGLTPKSAKVVETTTSDHNPLIVEFDVQYRDHGK